MISSRKSSPSVCGTRRVEADKLQAADLKDCYKIKLRSAGYRLVYRVDDVAIIVTVVTVGKRNRGAVYRTAQRKRVTHRAGTSKRTDSRGHKKP